MSRLPGESLFEFNRRLRKDGEIRSKAARLEAEAVLLAARGRSVDTRRAAERRARNESLLEEVREQWSNTRAAVEGCEVVTPELRAAWRQRLDQIDHSIDGRSKPARLDEMASEVHAVIVVLSGVSNDLDRAAAARELPGFRPFHNRQYAAPPIATGLEPFGGDLNSIRDHIMAASSVRLDLRMAWIARLEQLDTGAAAAQSSAAERARQLACAITVKRMDVDRVARELDDQAREIRRYWNA